MKIRRTVSNNAIKESFHFEWKFYGLSSNLHWNSHVFNGLNFFLSIIAVSFLLGWFWPAFFMAAGASVVLLSFQYLKTKNLARGILIQREVPKMAREKTSIVVHYTISNDTAFSLDGIRFRENFDGLESGHFLVDVNRKIPAHTQFRFTKRLSLDGGMGVKTISPFEVDISDELGIFTFRIHFQQESVIEVYPLIEETPTLKTAISPDTIQFGFYEIAKRGDSNLFIGTRDYRQGDPVKHINWKLSQKSQKLIVNEFEKNTNSYVTLLVDLHLDNQSGSGENSTWEAAKDLALSICANEIRKYNQIQVISNNLFIPFGTGKDQLHTVERHFTHHELENAKDMRYLDHLQRLPTEGQIFYICPKLTSKKVIETIELLMRLRVLGHHIVIFTIDPYEHLIATVRDRMRVAILSMDNHIQVEFEQLAKRLAALDIPVVNIKVKEQMEFSRQLAASRFEVLE